MGILRARLYCIFDPKVVEAIWYCEIIISQGLINFLEYFTCRGMNQFESVVRKTRLKRTYFLLYKQKQ
jgi:hypothetical protein